MHPTSSRRGASTTRLLTARTRSSAAVLVSILAAVLGSALLLCGLAALASLELRDAVRTAVPDPATADGWLQVQTRPADDTAGQDAAADAVFAGILGDDARIERLMIGEPGTDLERVAWRITPDPDALGLESVTRLADQLARVPEAFRESDAAVTGSSASGGLASALRDIADGARAASALLPVPLVVLGVLAWFAVLQLARLLGLSRGREAALLRARGLSAGQAAALSTGESTVLAALGTGLAWGALVALAAVIRPEAAPVVASTWPLAVAVFVGAAVTAALAQSQAARQATRAASAAGRIARAASPAVGVVLVVVGAVLVWQAQVTSTGGDTWALIVATLAPAFGVAAVAVLAVLLFGPVSALLAVAAARSRGLAPAYPARQVARRVSAYSVAVALVAIAVCGAVLASGYAAMSRATTDNSERAQAGAPLRVDVGTVRPDDAATARTVEGVDAAIPVVSVPIAVGDIEGRFLAMPTEGMTDVMFTVPGVAAPADLAQALAGVSAALPLAPGAAELTLSATAVTTAVGALPVVTGLVWLVDDAGLAVSAPLKVREPSRASTQFTDLPERYPFEAAATLPDGGPWRLASVSIAQSPAWIGNDVRLTAVELSVDGSPLQADYLTDLRLYGGWVGQPGAPAVVLWSAGGEDPARIPLVITEALARSLGLDRGDPFDLPYAGSGRVVGAVVADVVPAIAGIGDGPGAIARLDALVENQLPSRTPAGDLAATPPLPDSLWASGPAVAASALSEAFGGDTVTTPERQSAAVTAPIAATWTSAAVGGAALAGVALIALLAAVTRQRAGEVLVLRAIGVAPAVQARQRAGEAAAVVVLAAVLGAAGGLALSALLLPGLVRRGVPGSQLAPLLAFDVWPLVAAAVAIALGCAAGAVGISAAVRRQARSTRLEEAAP